MGFAAGALTLSVRLVTREWCDAARRFPPTQDSFVLLAALDDLWEPVMRSAGVRPLHLVSVHLHALAPADGRQGELFGPPAARSGRPCGPRSTT